MKISVLIPTFGRPADLLRCLGGLSRQTRPATEVLVAVRDDDPETSAALAGFSPGGLPLIVLVVGRVDASEARNRCLERSTGDILALTDDDTIPRPEWLEVMHDRFVHEPRLGALGGPDWAGGKELPVEERPAVIGRVQWWGRRIGNHHKGSRTALEVEWLKGANMSFRREALAGLRFGRTLRGRGAQFGEDVALSLQVRRAGWKVVYDPALAVDHFAGRLPGSFDHRKLSDTESLLDASHNDTVMLLQYLPRWRRAVFLGWAFGLGTRLLPGIAMAGYLALTRGDWRAAGRSAVVRRGRLEGWRRWRERNADVRLIEGIARPMAPDPVGRRPAVCLVTHVVAPWDGQGRVMDRLARYLVCRGIDVTLVASEVDRSLLAEAGLTWIRIPVWRRLPHLLQWLLFAILVPIRLRPSIRARFAVMHLNGAIAPIRADVNTAHFVHAAWRRVGDAPGRPALGWYQRLVAAACAAAEGRAFGTARVVVAVSGAVRRNLIRDAGVEPGRIRVVYNGVDPNEFRPRGAGEPRALRDALRLSDDNFLILFVGDAKSSRKNLDLALQALGRLPDRFVLAVIGGFRGGPYPNRAVALGVSWRTHFLGIRHDVPVCLRDADLVFCASRYEPASLVLLEAMASGVPVLSCPEVGNAVFVEQGRNGFLLRSGTDLDGAVRVIRALARDRSMGASIGREARRTAVQLSWGLMGEQYESIYRELLTQESNDSSRIRQPDPCTPALAAATERR